MEPSPTTSRRSSSPPVAEPLIRDPSRTARMDTARNVRAWLGDLPASAVRGNLLLITATPRSIHAISYIRDVLNQYAYATGSKTIPKFFKFSPYREPGPNEPSWSQHLGALWQSVLDADIPSYKSRGIPAPPIGHVDLVIHPPLLLVDPPAMQSRRRAARDSDEEATEQEPPKKEATTAEQQPLKQKEIDEFFAPASDSDRLSNLECRVADLELLTNLVTRLYRSYDHRPQPPMNTLPQFLNRHAESLPVSSGSSRAAGSAS